MHSMRVASFIWGKMRSAAQKTAPQRAVTNCSKEAGRTANNIYVILVRGE